MVDKMWTGLIRMYGQTPIRLQRYAKPSPSPKRRFRRICCLPAFLVVIAFWVAFVVHTSIIRLHSGRVAELLTNPGAMFGFILMSSLIFLSFFGSLPSICRTVRALTINPVKVLRTSLADFIKDEVGDEEIFPLKSATKCDCSTRNKGRVNEAMVLGNSTSLKNLAISAEEERACKIDLLLKEEFAKLCKLSLTFDGFLGQQQTRFIICLDAGEIKQRDVLAKLLYRLHNLTLSESTAPVAIVVESNFKTLLGELGSNVLNPSVSTGNPFSGPAVSEYLPQSLSDNLHLVHSSMHLPIYLEPPVFTDVGNCMESKERGLNSIDIPPNGYSLYSSSYTGMHDVHEAGLRVFLEISAANAAEIDKIARNPQSLKPKVSQQELLFFPLIMQLKGFGSKFVSYFYINVRYYFVVVERFPSADLNMRSYFKTSSNRGHSEGLITDLLNKSLPQLFTEQRHVFQQPKRPSSTAYTPRSLFSHRNNAVSAQSTDDKPGGEAGTSGRLSTSPSTDDKSYESCQGIAGLFIRDHELAEWNGKIMKQLVAATCFTSRFFRLCNVNISIDQLIFWITLVQYWPYHVAWLTICMEELNASRSHTEQQQQLSQATINLSECFREVKNRVAGSLDALNPLMSDDRDLEKLDSYLRSKSSVPITFSDLKKLISCVLIHSPFLRYCIEAIIPQISRRQTGAELGGFNSPLTTVMEECSDQTKSGNLPGLPYSISRDNSAKAVHANNGIQSPLNSAFSSENLIQNPSWTCISEVPLSPDALAKHSFSSRPKKNLNSIPLSQYSVSDVCDLVATIPELPPERLKVYHAQVKRNNINGLVLAVCDLNKLRQEMAMNFGDWQLLQKMIVYLRNREETYLEASGPGIRNRQQFQSGEFDDSESGSLVNSLIFRNKNTMILNDGAVSPNPKATTQQNLVRQTPWLLSPQVPTLTTSADNPSRLTPDANFSQAYHLEANDYQNSLSGMEEPESLWKSTVPVDTHSQPSPLVNSSVRPSLVSQNQFARSPKHIRDNDTKQEVYKSSRSGFENQAFTQDTNRGKDGNFSIHSHGKSNKHHRHANGKQYTSRSTVDLRTALGPWPFESGIPSSFQRAHNDSFKKSQFRGSIPFQRHEVSEFPKDFGAKNMMHNRAEGMAVPQEFKSPYRLPNLEPNPMAIFGASFGDHLPFQAPWKSEPEASTEEAKDLRRLKKRPCRRLLSSVSKPNDATLGTSASHHPNATIFPNCAQTKLGDFQPQESVYIDSDSDSMTRINPLAGLYPQLMMHDSGHSHTRRHRIRRNLPPPALNPSQIASLRSYIALSERMNACLSAQGNQNKYPNFLPSVGSGNMAPLWASYFQYPSNFPLICPSTTGHSSAEVNQHKPSQKKRSRRMTPEMTTIPNPYMSEMPTVPTILPSEYFPQGYELKPNFGMDECTCEYWYGLDQNGRKCTISEPTLRNDSDNMSSDEDTKQPNGSMEQQISFSYAQEKSTDESTEEEKR
ncbi:unnamed protein product [Calicophoron daubneyi]|uniref:Kinase D-interacting substrate of 220 kDa-like SAM domain-containing protein n=1 Tax=Calicophoron daubneyi TaxID=300641 RepID=A0AAV2T1I9_CALDB